MLHTASLLGYGVLLGIAGTEKVQSTRYLWCYKTRYSTVIKLLMAWKLKENVDLHEMTRAIN